MWNELNERDCWTDQIKCANLFISANSMENEKLEILKSENKKLKDFVEFVFQKIDKLQFPTEKEIDVIVHKAKKLLNK